MKFRELTLDDLDRLLEFEQNFPNPWEKSAFEIEFEGEFNKTLALEENGLLMSYVFYSEYFDEININHLAVNPKFEGMGYASKLLEKLTSEMTGQLLYLEVNTTNEKAIRLYKKFGLEIIRVRENYYGNGEDAYIMQREF